MRHIFRTARPTNFKFGIRQHDDPHQPQAPRPPRSKVKVIPGPLMLTHILWHLTNANLTLVVVLRISRPFPYRSAPDTHYARSILMRDRNIATEPNFRKSLSKSRILSPKTVANFCHLKQQHSCYSRSIDSNDVSPRPLTRVTC